MRGFFGYQCSGLGDILWPCSRNYPNTVVLSPDSAYIVCSYFGMKKGKMDVIRRVMNQPRIVSKRSFGAMTQVMSGEVASLESASVFFQCPN
ncbi:hypothetical protein CCUS01_16141 [Colletotrichum cuscutae]|uniref:Uncharacterized protein n=1 Tax=Colletotrichum cuscutae TaxID=1209917 RepID=A0AAI9Y6A5_9PEZI|nr:hypothetical protein CCUS01_16141 [Colletotrichum cuscutae]